MYMHPMYISVSTVNFNSSSSSLEITMKIFTDDLEEGIFDASAQTLNLGLASEVPEADSVLIAYLKERVGIHVNGKPVSLQFLGKEVEMQVAWVYLEARCSTPISEVQVHNEILMHLHEEQTNLVNIKVGSTKRSLLLSQKKKEDAATF